MASIRIIPRYKLLIAYDIRSESYERYQNYILREFVPGLQELGIYMLGAWHTAYGEYPSRQIEFVLENLAIMRRALADERWLELESTLKDYTYHYERRLVRFRQGFQFIV